MPESRRITAFRDFVAGLFLSRFAREARRGWGETLALTAAAATALIAVTHPYIVGKTPQHRPDDDHHSVRSLELATNWVVCGKYSVAFPGGSYGVFLMAPGSQELRLRDVPALISGSNERYCSLADEPWRNNENSLMLTMAMILFMHRDATLADVGHALRWIRFALVIGVAIVMLRCGVSFWLALGFAYASVIVMAAVEELRFYSVYPFLPVLLTGFVGVLVLLLDLRSQASLPRAGASAALVGFIAAIAANFRSSYLPVLLACFILWILLGAREWGSGGSTRWRGLQIAGGLLQIAGFAVGFALFQIVFIRPIDRLPTSRSASYHVIAHPLVLGLANPPNKFARDQGIEWDDRVGLDIARRIDPRVGEINKQYEAALFTYYEGLWRDHPREMAKLYWSKLALAGADIPKYSVEPVAGLFFKVALWPLSLVPHGAGRVLLLAALSVASLALRRGTVAARGLVAFTAVTLLLLTLETALILTYFYITHEAAILLFAVGAGLLTYQAVIDCAAAWTRRVLRPRVALDPTREPAS